MNEMHREMADRKAGGVLRETAGGFLRQPAGGVVSGTDHEAEVGATEDRCRPCIGSSIQEGVAHRCDASVRRRDATVRLRDAAVRPRDATVLLRDATVRLRDATDRHLGAFAHVRDPGIRARARCRLDDAEEDVRRRSTLRRIRTLPLLLVQFKEDDHHRK